MLFSNFEGRAQVILLIEFGLCEVIWNYDKVQGWVVITCSQFSVHERFGINAELGRSVSLPPSKLSSSISYEFRDLRILIEPFYFCCCALVWIDCEKLKYRSLCITPCRDLVHLLGIVSHWWANTTSCNIYKMLCRNLGACSSAIAIAWRELLSSFNHFLCMLHLRSRVTSIRAPASVKPEAWYDTGCILVRNGGKWTRDEAGKPSSRPLTSPER